MRGGIPLLLLLLPLFVTAAPVIADETLSDSIWHYAEPMPAAEDAKNFSGSLEGGDQVHSGSVAFRSASGLLGLKYDNGLSESVQTVNYQYLEAKGAVVANLLKSYTGYDRYLGSRIWAFVLNDYERNRPKKVEYSMLSGGGFKYDLLRNPFWKLNVGAALLHRLQKRTDGLTDNDEVMSYRIKFNVKGENVEYYLVLFYQPSLIDKTYGWSADTGVSIKMSDRFSLKTGYIYRYDSEPLDPTIAKWDRDHYARLAMKF